MNDMPMSTRTINNVDMHADDSTISVCGKNIQDIALKLNNELQEISNWCDENRMVASTKRTLTCASREIKSKWLKMRGYLDFMLTNS